jgi:hypothetical protein
MNASRGIKNEEVRMKNGSEKPNFAAASPSFLILNS